MENSPNSGAKSPNSCFFFNLRTQGLSLENSPNSSAEFGEFSKFRFKRKKSEFGEFFKLRFKISKLICSWKKWTGEKKQTQRLRGSQDLQCPGPNSFSSSENHGHEKKTQRLRLSPVWVQKVVRVSREQNFATREQLYSWESSREGEFSNLCCQNLQAYMWPARLYCCCFCKWKKLSKLSKLLRICVWRIP